MDGFALDGGSHRVEFFQGEAGDVANRLFFNLAAFAVAVAHQPVGIFAIGPNVEVVGFACHAF